MNPSELTDDELSREVALACRWEERDCTDVDIRCNAKHWWCPTFPLRSGQHEPPKFATSLDACFGPGGPVEWLSSRGLEISLISIADFKQFESNVLDYSSNTILGKATEAAPALAVCLTFLEAIKTQP